MVHCASEVVHLAVDLHVDLIEMPAPVANPAHRIHALPADVACEHRPEPVPPEAHSLLAQVDSALEQQILDAAQR